MIVKKAYYEFLKINITNAMLILISICIDNIISYGHILYVIIFSIYLVYLLKQNNTTIIKYQISFLLISSTILDNILLKTSLAIPLEIKYVVDSISIILILKIVIYHRKYIKSMNDPILILILFGFILNITTSIVNSTDYIDLLNGIRLYYRFLPIYIILSIDGFEYKEHYKYNYIIHIIIFVMLVIVGVHQDNINGIFGARGTIASTLFVLIYLSWGSVKYFSKEISFLKLCIMVIGTMILFVFQENKAFIFILMAIISVFAMLNNTKIRKKIIICTSCIVILFSGVNLLSYLYPEFSTMFSKNNYRISIENYLFGRNNPYYKLGRFDAAKYVINEELDTVDKKILGIGTGRAIPSENWYFKNKVRNDILMDFPKSEIYDKYGDDFGYHLSSFTTTLLEYGILGILIIATIFIIVFLESVYILLKSYNSDDKVYGAIGIFTILAILFPIIYNGALLERASNMILIIICGIIRYKYKDIKLKKI